MEYYGHELLQFTDAFNRDEDMAKYPSRQILYIQVVYGVDKNSDLQQEGGGGRGRGQGV